MTFFFNGGQEAQFEGEDRKLVPSPKVATYDLQPEMSCDGVAEEVIKKRESLEFIYRYIHVYTCIKLVNIFLVGLCRNTMW